MNKSHCVMYIYNREITFDALRILIVACYIYSVFIAVKGKPLQISQPDDLG